MLINDNSVGNIHHSLTTHTGLIVMLLRLDPMIVGSAVVFFLLLKYQWVFFAEIIVRCLK